MSSSLALLCARILAVQQGGAMSASCETSAGDHFAEVRNMVGRGWCG